MDSQEVSNYTQPKTVIRKSAQELGAQIESVGGTFIGITKNPEGESLDEKYLENRSFVIKLLESGISDEQIEIELRRLYENGLELGIYSPLVGDRKNDFLSHAKQQYLSWGFSETDAELEARRMLSMHGYLAELRTWRREYEQRIKEFFHHAIERHPITEAEESENIRMLRERVIHLTDSKQTEQLAVQFPGGNFLYHGTKVEQAIGILESGNLLSTKTLLDAEEERLKKDGKEKRHIPHNSGYEGISWNFNNIGALPGDRYHLAGFLASAQDVLTESQQLTIPSRPAPYELIQINGSINSNLYYSVKTQQELFINVIGLGKNNSVLSNIINFSLDRHNQANGQEHSFSPELKKFISSFIDDSEMSNMLRTAYLIRKNGTTELSPKLLQQIDNSIPVALVWFQALIDTERIKNIKGFEDVKTVREALQRINDQNVREFFEELRREDSYLIDLIKDEDEKITSISVPISKTYLIVPNTDLERYLKVIARSGTQPKGIIVYDHMAVRLENFASTHRGDNEAMTQMIRTAIPTSEGYIDYEKQILGTDITSDKMSGHRRHVVGEEHIANRRSLRVNDQGKVFVS